LKREKKRFEREETNAMAVMTRAKSAFQQPIIDEREREKERENGRDVTNDEAVLFHYL